VVVRECGGEENGEKINCEVLSLNYIVVTSAY